MQKVLSALRESLVGLLNRVPRRIRFVFFLLFSKDRKKLVRKSLTLAVVLMILSLAFFSFQSILGQFYQTLFFHSGGIIKTVGVGAYGDSSCSSSVPSVDWGTIEPGSMKNVTVYFRNEGNVVVTLFMYTDNWYPSEVSNYMTFSWDYANQTIDPLEVVKTTLTLSTSPDIEGITNFTFDIFIGVNA